MYRVNQGWLYGSVRPYFEKKGYKLLRDDMIFIEKCLSNIPPERHRLVMRDYLSIWDSNLQGKNKVALRGSIGRFEANAFLRVTSGMKGD